MIYFTETKFSFCGDEYILGEISRNMTIESTLKAISISEELRERNIPGILEIYPNNTSYLIRYNSNLIKPNDLLNYLSTIDQMKNERKSLDVRAKIIEIPVLYNDKKTNETSKRYNHLQENNNQSNFDYVMKKTGFKTPESFIKAHSNSLYFITALGFKPGLAWSFPLLKKDAKVLEVPKYKSPRPYTPERSIGVGGAFTVVYPTKSSGSYQLIGRAAVPVYDVNQKLSAFKENHILAKPGNLWKYRAVSVAEYQNIREEVKKGDYKYKTKDIIFSATEYDEKADEYIERLLKEFERL